MVPITAPEEAVSRETYSLPNSMANKNSLRFQDEMKKQKITHLITQIFELINKHRMLQSSRKREKCNKIALSKDLSDYSIKAAARSYIL